MIKKTKEYIDILTNMTGRQQQEITLFITSLIKENKKEVFDDIKEWLHYKPLPHIKDKCKCGFCTCIKELEKKHLE
jgi:hypothetical protein